MCALYLLGLVLHGDHPDEDLVTLDAESPVDVVDGVGVGGEEQGVHAVVVAAFSGLKATVKRLRVPRPETQAVRSVPTI